MNTKQNAYRSTSSNWNLITTNLISRDANITDNPTHPPLVDRKNRSSKKSSQSRSLSRRREWRIGCTLISAERNFVIASTTISCDASQWHKSSAARDVSIICNTLLPDALVRLSILVLVMRCSFWPRVLGCWVEKWEFEKRIRGTVRFVESLTIKLDGFIRNRHLWQATNNFKLFVHFEILLTFMRSASV